MAIESIRNNIYRQVIYKKPGDAVDVFDNAAKAVGIVFLHFDSPQEMEHFCTHHDSLIKINLR